MKQTGQKKITLYVAEDLLQRAQEETGVGISDTVRKALQLMAASSSYEELRKLRGKVRLNLDVNKLRADRRW
ncbi:MAG: hypothetical protein IT291_01305 [Deltaproteobacteria bacterium]|nr:hypothetical protein [Deltaproteobacteria bacterium]